MAHSAVCLCLPLHPTPTPTHLSLSLFNSRYKATVLGITPTQKKSLCLIRQCPYLKHTEIRRLRILTSCSNTLATSRVTTLSKHRTDLLKTLFSFSGAFLWNAISSSNKVMQFTYQLQNTAPQVVQKQNVINKRREKSISSLICNVYIHAVVVSPCYYEWISPSFVSFVMIVGSH